jgi:sulfate adenylyltransferase large subunit
MNAHSRPDKSEFSALLQQQEGKSLLRFIACGSVDHGKSTLLGRLLFESQQVFDDQLDALATDSRKFGTIGADLDFSLLLDGLAAEREQKITIDIAHRFFTTARRKFIVIDAPGHEEYTANMATGASLADFAVVLVAADEGLTKQTRRHLAILSMLGLRHVALAVNKMDRVDWSEETFRAIEDSFCALAKDLGIAHVLCIPLAAKSGDNVIARSRHMPWYQGPALLEYLENIEPDREAQFRPFRMPVQWVNRPDSDFRGYSGLIVSGEARIGMTVKICPSGRTTRIERIVTFDGDISNAATGRSVTLVLADEIDASRGDVIADAEQPPAIATKVDARILWMKDPPLSQNRNYLIKLGTRTETARVDRVLGVVDLDTRRLVETRSIAQNEIGVSTLNFDRPVAFDRYADCAEMGSFILIDPESCDTVGMGCVENVSSQPQRSRLQAWLPQRANSVKGKLTRWTESHARSLAKAVSWRATGSLDTFVVTLFITGNAKIAGSVAVTEILTKILIYYGHERVWALVPWGKRQAR